MISRKKVIWSHLRLFMIFTLLNIVLIAFPFHWDIVLILELFYCIITAAIVTLIPMIFAVNSWDRYYRVIYPIYEKEGFSDHFYEVALQYGQTLDKPRRKATYYVNLIACYQATERYEDSVKAFVEIDTAYIAKIKNSWNPFLRSTAMCFFNNGLYTCLKTGRLEDAKRMYRDGYDVLKKYENKAHVLDTLAEYHFQLQEYDKSIYYDEKLIARGGSMDDVAKYATKRLRIAREKLSA